MRLLVSSSVALVAVLVCCLAVASAVDTTTYEDNSVLVEADSATEATDYHADSGGCTPLVVWEHFPKNSFWWNWEARLPQLANRISKLSDNDAAVAVFSGLGDNNMWHQYIDGWSHLKGQNAFGPEYIQDSKKAHYLITGLMARGLNPRTFNVDFYDKIHHAAFAQTAGLLNKRNGIRGPDSWIYLPMPDKPLGVFHDIHNYGKMNYDPRLRVVDKMSNTWGLTWNGGFQYRWVYPNIPWHFGPQKVRELFDKFWYELAQIDQKQPVGVQRDKALNAIVHLYHSLENFHVFVDGNGRTNMLVLQTLLSFVGLHPVSFYNSMESALCSVEEMKEKVIEGYFRWEETYHTGRTGWTMQQMDKKAGECKRAIAQIQGRETKDNFGAVPGQKPDTMGGCMCENVSQCENNPRFNGRQWCFTDNFCTWKWDYCAGGRRQKD